jgi:Tfp pilus assembly protein PilZ
LFNHFTQAARRLNAEAAVLEAIRLNNAGTLAYQEPFNAANYYQRGLAGNESSEGSSKSSGSGCGSVAINPLDPKNPPSFPTLFGLISLLALPMLTWLLLLAQNKSQAQYRRRHPRFILNSDLSIKVGDKIFHGQLNTISEGGASFKSDVLLSKGGVVTLIIQAPDSNEKIEATARVVWNEQNQQACGVAFENETAERLVDRIRRWGEKLPQAS